MPADKTVEYTQNRIAVLQEAIDRENSKINELLLARKNIQSQLNRSQRTLTNLHRTRDAKNDSIRKAFKRGKVKKSNKKSRQLRRNHLDIQRCHGDISDLKSSIKGIDSLIDEHIGSRDKRLAAMRIARSELTARLQVIDKGSRRVKDEARKRDIIRRAKLPMRFRKDPSKAIVRHNDSSGVYHIHWHHKGRSPEDSGHGHKVLDSETFAVLFVRQPK